MAFETNRAEGIDPSAGRSVSDAPGADVLDARAPLQSPETVQASRAYLVAHALLSAAFTVFVTVVLTSTLGLAPLATRASAFATLGLGVAVAAWSTHRRWPRTRPLPALMPRAAPPYPAVRGVAIVCAVAGVAVTLASFALALLLPVGAYDALGYRLPAVVQWLEAGAVVWVRGDDPLRNGYPLALEVLEAVGFRAFGSPRAVDAWAHLFLLAGAAAIAGYARTLGLTRGLAALAAGLFLLVPMHVLNAPSGYADAAFAGALVAFFIALARWVEVPHPSVEMLAELGITAAFALALKPHGFAFVGTSLLIGLGLRSRATGVLRAAKEAGTVFALLSPALFFAVRNVLKTGNPIYPLELRVGTRVLLRGKSSLDAILTPDYNVPPELAVLPTWLRPLWVWLQPDGPARTFDDRLAGFGYTFLLLGLPAMAWLCWRSYRMRGEPPGLALVLALSWLCWLLQPLSFWSRFTSWLWGAAALAIALAIHALLESGRAQRALALASCALCVALPEALYALYHVKRIDQFGLSLLHSDPLTALTNIAGVSPEFVRRELVGKADVCRTPWRIGTDDANLDGVVAQLAPRPRMHVIEKAPLARMLSKTRASGCAELIVIGDNPLLAHLPASLQKRVVHSTAFGAVLLLPVLSVEVIP